MSNSGPDGAGARREDETGDQDYARLRELLVGPERAQLAELEARLRDFSLRASDVGEVLPEAVLLRGGRDPALRQALQPLLVEALRSAIRKDPSLVADTMFPIIGAAVRKSVASALQDLTDTLNQVVESSLSMRSLGWRIEALRTGRTYGEIALSRSLLYRVEQVFLIHRGTGLLLAHVTADSAEARDPALVSAMLSAIQDFVHDSFGGSAPSLEMVRVGGLSVWIQHGPQALLAGVVRGAAPPALRHIFAARIEAVHHEFAEQLDAFDGDAAPFAPCRPHLQSCLYGQGAAEAKRSYAPVYAMAALIVAALAGWFWFDHTRQKRWDDYLALLARQPGVVVTAQQRSGGRYRVAGLRDPLAVDPSALLATAGLASDRVESRWSPYVSLVPRFAAERALPGLRAEVERHRVQFALGKSELTPAEREGLKEQAQRIAACLQTAAAAGRTARVLVTGNTDELGAPTLNEVLARDRAAAVAAELARLGVDAGAIGAEGGEIGKASGRSARFRVSVSGY